MPHVPISAIEFDSSTQVRAEINNEVVERYAEAMREGAKFPAVQLFRDGAAYYIGDGWHRLIAAQNNGDVTFNAFVQEGGRIEALKCALSANAIHGQPRTNADKRKAVEVALKEFSTLSSREIAKMCAVHHSFVEKQREQVATVATSTKRIGADGKTYTVEPKQTAPMRHEPRVHEEEADEDGDFDAAPAKDERPPIGGDLEEIERDAAKLHKFFNAESWAKQTRTLMDLRMAEAAPSARAECAEEMLRIAQTIWAKHQPTANQA